MTMWKDILFEKSVREILQGVKYDPAHHFGRPFLTAYQIAIEFSLRYPEDFKRIDLDVGGKGKGKHSSLAQYIARQLSVKIKSGILPDIEGRFISNTHLQKILFNHGGETVESSLTDTQHDLSMYRFTGI